MIGRGQYARLARRARGWPWVTFFASLVAILASLLPAEHLLAFTLAGIQRGQLWRLWTGHWVHYGSAHLWGDWLAFLVWAALVEGESRRVLVATLSIGAPLLLFLLLLACPALGEYRGLSGIDTALVSELIVLRGFAQRGSRGGRGLGPWLTRLVGRPALQIVGSVSLLFLVAKIVYEFQAGRAILAHDLGLGVKLLPAAHAFGALIGLCIGLGRIASPRRTLYTG